MLTKPWQQVIDRILANPNQTYVWVDCGNLQKSILVADLEAIRFCKELAREYAEIPCFFGLNGVTFLGTAKT